MAKFFPDYLGILSGDSHPTGAWIMPGLCNLNIFFVCTNGLVISESEKKVTI